jgi:hypothetical protein
MLKGVKTKSQEKGTSLAPLYLLEKGKTKNLLLGKVEQNFWLHLF